MIALAAGALLGLVAFLSIFGTRLVNPREFAWVMREDWRIHFLGWHLFRTDAWHWPPGRMMNYYAPDGSAIAFTDSIPLVAFALKPVSGWLPNPFQYLGLWLALCFTLQGVFAVLIVRLWTRNVLLQVAGAAFFVLMPTLLARTGHPALCAHFLILWALWLNLRDGERPSPAYAQHVALGLCAGLIHPYLAVMALALLAARAVAARGEAAVAFVFALLACLTGWWASGLFTVSGNENLASEGLGYYSMNLVSPITPSAWSAYLPELPVAARGQYEGFQYLGLGTLAVGVMSIGIMTAHARTLPWRRLILLAGVCLLLALYALSPRVTIGSGVVVDWSSPRLEGWAIFRATGRFFWPMAYLLVASAVALVVSRLGTRVAAVVLIAGVALQVADLRHPLRERAITSRSDDFHHWANPLPSPAWHAALPHYDHLVLAPPRQCGSAPVAFEAPAFLAGLHGLTINSAEVARFDEPARRAYCSRLRAEMIAGAVDDRTLYILDRPHAAALKAAAQKPLVCGTIDVAYVCVTADSYKPWRQAAVLQ